jgi:hypothetical protein
VSTLDRGHPGDPCRDQLPGGSLVTEHIQMIIAGLVVVCVLCQWLASRVKLPAIIFLLLVGHQPDREGC